MTQPLDPRASFFTDAKVRTELRDWYPLNSSKGEKRVRLDLVIPLTNDNRKCMLPGWALPPLQAMELEQSAETEAKLSVVLDGMTLEFWSTPKSRERMQMCASTTLGGFALKRITKESEQFLALCFNTAVPANDDFVLWCWRHLGAYLWIAFTPTQAEIREVREQSNLFDAGAVRSNEIDGAPIIVAGEFAMGEMPNPRIESGHFIFEYEQEPGNPMTTTRHVCTSEDPEACTWPDHAEEARAARRAGVQVPLSFADEQDERMAAHAEEVELGCAIGPDAPDEVDDAVASATAAGNAAAERVGKVTEISAAAAAAKPRKSATGPRRRVH